MENRDNSSSRPFTIQDQKRGVNYVPGDLLGRGGFAKVYEVTDANMKPYAAKIVDKTKLSKTKKAKLISEIEIHRKIAGTESTHSNIVRFLTCFEDRASVYIILEKCGNRSLSDLLKKRKTLTEPEARVYLQQTIAGVRHLHRNNIIHRDLKLGNLFLTSDMTVKVGDFGLAAKLEALSDRRKTMCGTPNYMAPEVLQTHMAGKKASEFRQEHPDAPVPDHMVPIGHSFEVDTWAIGVILYTMLIGRPPFECSDAKEVYKRIMSLDFEIPAFPRMSNAAKDLIKRVLVTDPFKRPTLDQIVAHEWFRGYTPDRLDPSAMYERPDFVTTTSTAPPPSDYLVAWVDYTKRYGFGYQLASGAVGVFFNDHSKIVYAPSREYFEYHEKKLDAKQPAGYTETSDRVYPGRGSVGDRFKKKYSLLKYFAQYLDSHTMFPVPEEVRRRNTTPDRELVYIRKYSRVDEGHMVFRFSNKILQTNFTDHTKVVLNATADTVMYIDEEHKRRTHYMREATGDRALCPPAMARAVEKFRSVMLAIQTSERAGVKPRAH